MDILTFHSVEEAEPYWLENLCQTPFDTFLWSKLWAKHSHARPLILVAVDEKKPIAVCPLRQETNLGTTLRFLPHPTADYSRILTSRTISQENLTTLLKSIRDFPWHLLELTHISEDDFCFPAILNVFVEGKVEPEESCPYLPLPATWEELLGRLKKKTRDKVKYYQRKAEEAGTVQLVVAETSEEVKRALDTHFFLHSQRWRRRGQPGVYWSPRVMRFHRELAPAAAERNMCRIYTLYISTEPVASLYGFSYREKFYFYTAGFHPKWKEMSPGFLLVSMAIQDAIRRKETCFDFLRGEEKYKFRWRPESRKEVRIWVHRPNLFSRIIFRKAEFSFFLEKIGKKLLQSPSK